MTRETVPTLRVESTAGAAALAGLREEWEGLRAVAGAGVFMSWEWMATWWEHYGEGRELCLLTVRDPAGALVGVAPLMRGPRRYRGLPVRVVELLGAGSEVSPDLVDIPARADLAAAVGRVVWAHLAEHLSWDLLLLDNLAPAAGVAHALAAAAARDGRAFEVLPKASCPFVPLPGTWEGYLAGRGAATRYDLGRKARALARRHDVKLERAEGTPDLEESMRVLFDLHAGRWRMRGEAGTFDRDPRNRSFHQAMAAAAQRRGWLRLYFLAVDGRRVAGFLGYEVDAKLCYYQLGWDPAWARWSVGTVLIAEVLRDAIARGVREFDFLRAAERYKVRLADDARQTITLRVWGPTPRGRLYRALHRAARWARQEPEGAAAETVAGSVAPDRAAVPAVSVRPYRPGDEEAMAALYNAAHGHLAGFIERSAERVRWLLSRPGLEREGICVAERGGKVAGYAVVYREGEIAEMAADPADAWPVADALLAAAESYVASRGGDRVAVLLPPGYAAHDAALWDRGYGLRPESLGQLILVDAVAVLEAILAEKLGEGPALLGRRFQLRVAPGLYAEPLPPAIHIALSRDGVKVHAGEDAADVTIALAAEDLAELIYGGVRPAAAWMAGRVQIRPWPGVLRGLALLRALRVTDPWYFPMGDCR